MASIREVQRFVCLANLEDVPPEANKPSIIEFRIVANMPNLLHLRTFACHILKSTG